MRIIMMKKCSCGHFNDSAATICGSCRSGLSYAEEVYVEVTADGTVIPPAAGGSPAPPPPKGKLKDESQAPEHPQIPTAPGTGACTCKFPGERNGVCVYCGNRMPGPGNTVSRSGPLNERTEKTKVLLMLPGMSPISVDSGLLLGRDSSAVRFDVAVTLAPFRGVSRRHLWLGADEDEVLLLDLGSRNGTWADGTRLEPFSLHRVPFAVLPLTLRLGAGLVASVGVGGVL